MATVKLPTSRKALNALAKKHGIEKPQFIPLAKLKKEVKEVLKSSGGGEKKKKRGPGRPPGSGKKATPAKKTTGKKRGRPPGSGKKAASKKGVPGAKKRGPGRPPGSGKKSPAKAPAKRGPGRPPKSETAAKVKKTTAKLNGQVNEDEEFNLAAVERAVKSTARRMKGIDEFATMFSEEFPELVKSVKILQRDVKWLRNNFEEILAGGEEEEETPEVEETEETEETEEQEEETPTPEKKKKKKKKKKTAPVEEEEEVEHTGDNGETIEGETEESADADVVELDVDKIQSAKLPELYKMGDSVEYGDEMRSMKKDGKNVKYIRAAFLKYLKENASLD